MKKNIMSKKELKKYENMAKKDLAIAKKKFTLAENKTKQYLKTHPKQAAMAAAALGAAAGAAMAMVAGKLVKKK